MNDQMLELLTSAHRGIGDLIAGREPLGDDLLAAQTVVKALISPEPCPYDPAAQALLEASRAGNTKACAVLKAFGQEAFHERHPEKRPLFTVRRAPTPALGGNFFR